MHPPRSGIALTPVGVVTTSGMLSTVARFGRGPVEFAAGIAFERKFRLHAIDRRGLVFDTRFAPAIAGASRGVILYLLLDGTLRWADGQEVSAPSLFLMPERDFEGHEGTRTRHFRSWGAPFRSIELRVAREHCHLASPNPQVIDLASPDDPIVSAGRTYLHASHAKRGQTVVADLAAAYLEELSARGVLATKLSETIVRDEGAIGLLWEGMRPLIDGFGGGLKQDDVMSRVGWGARRLQRELSNATTALGLDWFGGWREVTLRYRVRFAALLLSNPALSVGEIATAVGYASVEALAHAFEACQLPSATEIRRALVEGPGASSVGTIKAATSGGA